MIDATLPAPFATDPCVINSAVYENGVKVAEVGIDELRASLAVEGRFVWLGLFEPDAELLRRVQQQFGLHDLAIEDAFNAHQRPKLELYQDTVFVVLRTAQLVGDAQGIEFGETHVFVGRNFIVSVRHGSMKSHVALRTRCESTPHLLTKGPGFVLYALLDFVVDQYFPIVDQMEEQLESLEDEIFGDHFSRETTGRIYRLKRDLLAMKRAVSPLVDVCNRLMRFDSHLLPEDTRPYYRDVYDHTIRINEMIDTTRELLTTALEANLSLISVSQNEATKRLAAWAAIIAVPTAVAGIYGMNFNHMPELAWEYGYPFSLALMVGACAALYFGFKRTGWL